MSLEQLKEKSREFNLSQEIIDKREKDRLSFVREFPLNEINNLNIDQYVQGTDKNSFCYWLEFKKILFGIGGGNASKFGVYKAKDNKYYTSYGKNKKELSGQELEDFFSNIKSGIIKALEYTENDQIDKIQKIDIPLWNIVLQKILCIYFPNKFITIGSPDVLIKCAKCIKLEGIDLKRVNSIQINYECKKVLSDISEFKDWPYEKIGTLVWNYFNRENKKGSRKDNINSIFFSNNNGINNFESIKSKFQTSLFDNYIKFLRKIISDLKIQYKDLRIVYSIRDNSLNFIVGQRYCFNLYVNETRGVYGVISKDKLTENCEPFQGNPPQPYYSYFNEFKPNTKEWKTIIESIEEELRRTHRSGYRKYNDEDFENYVFSIIDKSNTEMNYPLNTILYGPPGTGKTYNSIDKAVAVATGSSFDHVSNKTQFDELRKQGQIEFVTFHQNYSYEDFMVGIRPNVSETTSELSFKKHYGIFFEIAKRARENYENSYKDEQTISKENWAKEKFEEFKEYIETKIEKNGKYALKNKVSIYAVEDEAFIYTGEKENGELWNNQRIRMHYDALINIYLANVESRKDIKLLDNVPALEKQHATYSFELVEKFKEFLNKKNYKFQLTTVKKEPLKNFVLIIDEINRANISKVFGELITLLEDDKRLGMPNELKITLPNGEKEFGVPPNLYLIGTMNTADKSIALIDIALRRRFEFLGFYPNYDNLKPQASELLQKINEEIYKLKNSADYLIGHAYFMKDEAIETTLRNKVVPLLMEYFSGKTKIVSDIFNETTWKVEYDTSKFDWIISQR